MNDEFIPRDFLGREIYVGVTVIYPVRRGSSMWLNKIKVTAIGGVQRRDGEKCRPIQGVNDNGRRVTLSQLNRCLIAPILCEYCGHNPYSSEG